MELWVKASLLVCLWGFFKAMRPSEPFLTPYLKAPPINLTEEQLDNQVYPVWTYAYLVSLFVFLLITDFLRYKPIIICEGFAFVATRVFLIWGRGLAEIQVMQIAYGIATGAEIAYYSYLYALVQPQHFRKVTSFTRAAVLLGRMMSGIVGQMLISLHITGYLELYYISLVSVCIALIISFTLPAIKENKHSNCNQGNGCQGRDICEGSQNESRIHTYSCKESDSLGHQGQGFHGDGYQGQVHGFYNNGYQKTTTGDLIHGNDHHDTDHTGSCLGNNHYGNSHDITNEDSHHDTTQEPSKQTGCCFDCKQSVLHMWHALKECYSNEELFKWSLWWALGTCGDNQVENYASNLWDIIYPSHLHKAVYNGGVDASAQLVSSCMALLLGYWKVNWSVLGELFLALLSVIEATALYISAGTSNIWMAYLMYILFRISYTFLFVIASYQIARNVKMTRYALVLGCNTFISLLLQSILTFIVVDERGLGLDVVIQFVVYGTYFYILGAAFLGKAVYTMTRKGWKNCWRERLVRDDEPEKKTKYQSIS